MKLRSRGEAREGEGLLLVLGEHGALQHQGAIQDAVVSPQKPSQITSCSSGVPKSGLSRIASFETQFQGVALAGLELCR